VAETDPSQIKKSELIDYPMAGREGFQIRTRVLDQDSAN
jgi:hypothetical protein